MSRPGAALRESALQTTDSEPAPWPFETSLLVAGLRCTLRYIVLPFALPLAGITAGAALPVLLVLDTIAAVTVITTLRRLWQAGHPSRWLYLLPAAGVMTFLAAFFLSDARAL